MKKLFCIFLSIFCIIAVANAQELKQFTKETGYTYVQFGGYPQSEMSERLPILWRVLKTENNHVELLSEYILFNHRIHHDDKAWVAFHAQFNKTEIFELLNTKFLQAAFNASEQKVLHISDELGSIYLVTAEDILDANLGFTSNLERKAFGTPYAIKNGLFKYSNRYGGHSPYWTRSQSTTKAYGARCTKQDGNLGYIRVVVMNEGIRPAITIQLDKIEIFSGNGTVQDPYVLKVK